MKSVILVPKGKCPLDVLAELGGRTAHAWIFMHEDVVESLRRICDEEKRTEGADSLFYWYGTSVAMFPQPIRAFLSACTFTDPWRVIACIDAPNIAFNIRCDNPKEIIFLKMAE